MMTSREIKKYIKLQDKFQSECERVCRALSKYDKDYSYLSEFRIEDDRVYGEGHETWSYGGYEEYYENFPLNLLQCSDEALTYYVDSLIEFDKLAAQQKEETRLAKERESDLKEYNRLKEKLGL